MKTPPRAAQSPLSSLLLIIGICAPTALAQMRPPTVLVRAKQPNETERERDLKSVPKVPPVSRIRDAKIRASLMKQLADDKPYLQLVANEMMSEAVASKRLNCNHVRAADVTQIKARASSLKTGLAPRSARCSGLQKDQTDTITDQGLSELWLDSLDQSIQEFVKNPIFRDPKVLDVNLSIQASRNQSQSWTLVKRSRNNVSKLTPSG